MQIEVKARRQLRGAEAPLVWCWGLLGQAGLKGSPFLPCLSAGESGRLSPPQYRPRRELPQRSTKPGKGEWAGWGVGDLPPVPHRALQTRPSCAARACPSVRPAVCLSVPGQPLLPRFGSWKGRRLTSLAGIAAPGSPGPGQGPAARQGWGGKG